MGRETENKKLDIYLIDKTFGTATVTLQPVLHKILSSAQASKPGLLQTYKYTHL